MQEVDEAGREEGGGKAVLRMLLLQCLAAAKYLHFHFWFIIVIAMCKLPKRRCKQAAGNHYKGTQLSIHECVCECVCVLRWQGHIMLAKWMVIAALKQVIEVQLGELLK